MKAEGGISLPPSSFCLSLADDTHLVLYAGDETADQVLAFWAWAARLLSVPLPAGEGRRLLVTTAGHDCDASHTADQVCTLQPPDIMGRPRRRNRVRHGALPLLPDQWFWRQLARLSACIAGETQPRGGVLLHSGLAVCLDSKGPGTPSGAETGVLLAGRSGVGKSTACRRLPRPWRALADDMTLVVRDSGGRYRAHPWPTWSRFFGDEAGDGSDTWDVQQSVALRAIVILEQGSADRMEPLGPGHAVALLSELARQASFRLTQDMPLDRVTAFHRQRFDNLCALVRTVPAYRLHASPDGAFWHEMERVLGIWTENR